MQKVKFKLAFTLVLIVALCLGIAPAFSQRQPAYAYTTDASTYYSQITATSGTELLGQLHDLITTTHAKYTTYAECGNASNHQYVTQSDPGSNSNALMEFYTQADINLGTFDSSGGWNREHVWPKSNSNGLWTSTVGGGADLQHIRPAEKDLNNARGNNKYGVVGTHSNATEKYTSKSGSYGGNLGGWLSSGTFEPLDNVKGDVARILFYVYTHYNTYSNVGGTTNGKGSSSYFGTLKFTHNVNASNEEAAIAMLLEWNKNDPVDSIETNRNDFVASLQGNRNPFIDNPEYANAIWGDGTISSDPLESIAVNPTTASVAVGATTNLSVAKTPANAAATVTWVSSHPGIATVSANGVVTGVAQGTATITATAVDKNDSSVVKTATATVSVKGISDITISGTPAKLAYTAGEAFDPTGLTVTVKYSDNTTAVVPNSSCEWLDGLTKQTKLASGSTSVICKVSGREILVSASITVAADPNSVTPVNMAALQENTPYKMALDHVGNGKTMYMTSAVGEQYYLGMTDKIASAPDIFVQIVEGGFHLYFKNGETLSYVNTVVSGTHVNLGVGQTAQTVWRFDSENNCIRTTVTDKGDYYLGSFSTMQSYRPSALSYITGENAANVGKTQYLAYLAVRSTAPVAPVTGITLNKSSLTLKLGATEKLSATLTGITGTPLWSSSDSSIITVAQDGTVTAVGEGSAFVSVAADGKTATCKVTVSNNLTLDKTTASLKVNESVTVTADATGTVTWETSNSSVATVANGTITATGEGTATITASCNGKTATISVTVVHSFKLDKTNVVLKVGTSQKLIVTEQTGTVEFVSSNTAVATVAQDGTITAVSAGTAHVVAHCGSTAMQEVTVVVTDGEVVTGTETVTITYDSGFTKSGYATLPWSQGALSGEAYLYTNDEKLQFSGKKDHSYILNTTPTPGGIVSVTLVLSSGSVNWELVTSQAAFGTVSGKFPTNGTSQGAKLASTSGVTWELDGTDTYFSLNLTESKASYVASITVVYNKGNGNVPDTPEKVVLDKSSATLNAVGATVKINVTESTGTPYWSTSNASIATVAQDGTVTAVGKGTATITAKCGNASATCAITVDVADSLVLDRETATMKVGETLKLNATANGEVVWVSRTMGIATVEQDGTVTALAEGSVVIQAQLGSIIVTCTITISNSVNLSVEQLTVEVGKTATLGSEATGSIVWSSSNEAVATVANGVVTGVAEGTATITATVGTATATCAVTVTKAQETPTPQPDPDVTLDKTELTIEVGATATITATPATNVVWISSNTGIATVSGGVVTAVSAGSATISATRNGVTVTCTVTVPLRDSVTLDKTALSLKVGEQETLVATASAAVVWTSSNPNAVTVENGVVKAIAEGTATITATCSTASATCMVTVTAAQVAPTPTDEVTISLTSVTLTVSHTKTLTATATGEVTWSSSNTAVATVEGGVVKAIAEGTATITVTCGTATATCVVTVISAYTPDAFKAAVAALDSCQNNDETFYAIKVAREIYSNLGEPQREQVTAEYEKLQAAVTRYNDAADKLNHEAHSALETALASASWLALALAAAFVLVNKGRL